MARCLLTVLPLAFAAATSPLAAQWQLVPALNPPPARINYTVTPLPNGELLLFGGDAANPAATELVWNGISWRPLTTPVPRRHAHAAAADTSGHTVVFGGFDAASNPLLDTWTFDGTTWTQVVTANAPSNLGDMTMAFDPRGGGFVLVGSTFPSGHETWRFDQGNWTLLATAALPNGAASVYTDTVRSELAAFVLGGPGLQTYRLDGGVWTLTTQQALATITGSNAAAFDSERGHMFGLALGLPGSTIDHDGLTSSVFLGVVPPASFTQRLVYHQPRHERLCVVSTQPLSVWRWLADPSPFATAHGDPCVASSFELALAAGDVPQPGATHRLRATGPGTALTLDVIGFSHTQNGSLPLPQTIPLGALGCQLRVEAVLLTFLGVGLPATHSITLPNTPSVLGARYDAQCLQLDATGVTDASNALEVQIGLPLPEHSLVESFVSDAGRDVAASGDTWGNGVVTTAAIGGDGKHGSFDPAFGAPQGNGVFQWNLDQPGGIEIPANNTPSGQPFAVTDGRFFFTDLVVPAGVTVRFVGSVPPQIFVRGRVDIAGTIDCSAVDMPFVIPTTGPLAGQRASQFNAKGTPSTVLTIGQPGGLGGAGGGRGGDGGRECNGLTGPIIIVGVNISDGQPGQDVRVAAGHAYAAQTVGTGGAGSPIVPASGLASSATLPLISASVPYRRDFSRGGGGGGFMLAGGSPALPTILPATLVQPAAGPAVSGGVSFAVLPFPASPPPGYQSLNHFVVGGSGGGGGGAHLFSTSTLLDGASGTPFISGHGGSGGGGAIALRAGSDLTVHATGAVLVRGGRGVVINGNNLASPAQDIDLGVSSPGGGGSGGSVLLQSSGTVAMQGLVDAGGGEGSRTSNIATSLAPTQLNANSQAGAGSDGYYRLEGGAGAVFTGTGVPAFNPGTNSGALADLDARTGSRSLWLLPATSALPYWLHYELVADVGGQTLLFSDDPNVSPLAANDPAGAVQLRFQGARLDASGNPIAGTLGPWRAQLAPSLSSVNEDRASAVRFDLVVDKTQGPIVVRELRLVWR